MSSIYDLDPRVRKLLSLDNFLGDFTVYEFIEELSKEHVTKSKEVNSAKYLDPKPFIRTFESTLRELKQLNTEAIGRKSSLEKEVEKFELDHSRNVLSLTSRTDTVNSQFKQLDDQISQVTSRISPLTENLARTINAKERSLATISLIRIYTEFYKSGSSRELDSLIKGSIKDKRTCASTVAQLLSLSEKLISDDLENSKSCHGLIQKYSESMENSFLEEFDAQYKAHNLPKMKEIADILTDFNGGTAVIKNFVNQHNFFINAESSFNEENLNDEKLWDRLSDPNNHEALSTFYSSEFYSHIDSVLKEETVVIIEVFRDSVSVLELFIQRIYAQQIQTRIETLLKNAYSSSTLAYIRTLYSLYVSTGNFTKDLKGFFTSSLGIENSTLDDLSSVLDQSYSDLFTQHLSDSKYLELEKKTLESIFDSITSYYEQVNEFKITGKLSARLVSSSKNNGHVNEYENLNRRSRVGQFKNFMKSHLERNNSFKRSGSSSSINELNEQEAKLAQRLDLKQTESLLKSTVESLLRITELTPYKTAESSLEILEILLIGVGKSYLDLGLEASYNELHHQDYRSSFINFDYLYNVNISSEILYLVSTCIRTIILPLSNNSPQIRQRIISLTNGYISRVELSINFLIKDTLQLSFDKVTNSLSKQKKKDFLATELLETDTQACVSLSTFLTEFYEQITEFLNGQNLHDVLKDLGDFTYLQLFEHYKNFQVNSTGGIILTKDIISYQTAIEQWKIPEVSQKFQLLREIANLFTVQPDLVNSLTKEGHLANVKPYVLRSFISKRADYNTNSNYLQKLRDII